MRDDATPVASSARARFAAAAGNTAREAASALRHGKQASQPGAPHAESTCGHLAVKPLGYSMQPRSTMGCEHRA